MHGLGSAFLAVLCLFSNPVLQAIAAGGLLAAASTAQPDPRHILQGVVIADALPYYDQPQIVHHPSGDWICVLTGASEEGDPQENVYVTRSTSNGRTWEIPRAIEPPHIGGPPAAWVNPIMSSTGRVYAYYTYDSMNHSHLPGSSKARDRTDLLGQQVFRFSDDAGRTFSTERYVIPIAEKLIDRTNEFNGSVHEGWAVGKPISVNSIVHTQFTKRLCASPTDKTPRCGRGRTPQSKLREYTPMQAFVVSSPNIESEVDPTKITWNTMPEGDTGLRAMQKAISSKSGMGRTCSTSFGRLTGM